MKKHSRKSFNDSKAITESSNDMGHIYKTIEEFNPNKKRKLLIKFNNMILDFLSNEKPNPIETELFIRGRRLNISFTFTKQCYFAVPRMIRRNFLNYFIMKILSKQELQQIAFNQSSDIKSSDLQIFTKNVLQNHLLFL